MPKATEGRMAVLPALCLCMLGLASMAHAQAVYYVDPDYRGGNGTSDGSALRPWTGLPAGSVWATINASLAAGDVTVYFSAKEARSAASQELGAGVVCRRTDTSGHRLTLDGMATYNLNDSNPSADTWLPNPNPALYKTKLVNSGEGIALGWYRALAPPLNHQDNITLRGFECSGPSARVSFGGDNLIIEELYVHDVTDVDPGMTLLYAALDDCTPVGNSRNVVIRNNTIVRTMGEGLYIGGTRQCTALGNTHDTILIEGNRIADAGIYGGQGDGIDLKDGLTNVTVRRNTIVDSHNGSGMTVSGGYGKVDQNLLIEWNSISRSAQRGILVGSNWGDPRGYIIRFNTITHSSSIGVSVSGGSAFDIFRISILSNTVAYNGGAGITVSYTDQLSLLGNLVFSNNAGLPNVQFAIDSATRNSGTALSDYNLFSPGCSDANAKAISGSHDEIRADPAGLQVDPVNPGWKGMSVSAPTAVKVR